MESVVILKKILEKAKELDADLCVNFDGDCYSFDIFLTRQSKYSVEYTQSKIQFFLDDVCFHKNDNAGSAEVFIKMVDDFVSEKVRKKQEKALNEAKRFLDF